MASGFTPAAKRFRRANEATSVRKRGKELGIPWKDISQAQISKWLVVCLMGQSTARVGCRIRAESINLFMICLRDPGTGKSPAFQQCSASKVACWGKRRYPLVCGWVHRSRTVPPTQGDTRPQGHHWKRRGVPFFNSYWEGHERKTGLTLKGWSSCIMGVHGCTQEMTRQHVSSSTIQRFHWVSIASPIPLSPFMLSWRREEIVVLTGWLFINHSHIAWQPLRRESS